jgi:hypothetical protein
VIPVVVGPESDEALVADATAAWQRLAAAEPGLAAAFDCAFRICDHRIGQTIAAAGLVFDSQTRPAHGLLTLGARFFEAAEEDRLLTMMHEAIHLVLYWTILRDRAIESETLRLAESARQGPMPSAFDVERLNGAKSFRLFVDEVLAEQYLQRRCPDHAAARVKRYLGLREDKRATALTDVRAELRCYGLLYEIACNDLGAQISTHTEARQLFASFADADAAELAAGCGDPEALLAMRPRLLGVDLDRPPYDFTPYDEMWDRVITTPKAARQTKRS